MLNKLKNIKYVNSGQILLANTAPSSSAEASTFHYGTTWDLLFK